MAVLVLCVGGLGAMGAQIRCIDAAREAARLASRGEGDTATAAARRIAPSGAEVHVAHDGGLVVARVRVGTALPGFTVSAEAAAVPEPGVG
ncbi:TadE family type IV pilus minor pilin [[Mycobacterium] fortunisiensis]|uniref:TadE family type IV pilus minor pilin n=1 Tax=[Mycobacterium] fortunisiensis TaxID=2600579 RepID=UPI0027E05240|nr:TadE family type IV pilus minor pilin [[Mycobacterium] fortunisiensis]